MNLPETLSVADQGVKEPVSGPGTTGPLHLIRLELDSPGLLRQAIQRRPPLEAVDLGYLVHCQLVGLFGDAAPRPFLVKSGRGRHVEVWGYARGPKEPLRETAQLYADPKLYEAVDWQTLHDRRVPLELLRPGRVVGFELRACPVVRVSRNCRRHPPGSEVDVFLERCCKVADDVRLDRELIYLEWLEARLQGHGVELVERRLRGHRRVRLLRRQQDGARTPRVLEKPEAWFEGTLRVTDGAALARLLARGVGRHRAFGFGMLLLRPPGRGLG